MKFTKTILDTVIAATSVLLTSAAFAQADSTTGNRALTGRGIVPLANQERETPVVNHNSYITQTVGLSGRVFQVGGWDWATCPGGSTLISGGGYCSTAIEASERSGNSWHIKCDSGSSSSQNVFAMCAWD